MEPLRCRSASARISLKTEKGGENGAVKLVQPRRAERTQHFKVPRVPSQRLYTLRNSLKTNSVESSNSSQKVESEKETRQNSLRSKQQSKDSTSASEPLTPRTSHRICKDLALAKILKCFEQLSTSPTATPNAPQFAPPTRRRTMKEEKGLARSSQSRHSPDASFSSLQDNSSSTDSSDSEEEETSEEDSTSSTTSSDASEGYWSCRTKPRRRATKRLQQTSTAGQVFVPPRRTTSSNNDHGTLNIKLHASLVSNDCLPCREREFDAIFEFLFAHLRNRIGGCMYISGVPGTGKTATVAAVVKSMVGCVDEDGGEVIPPFVFVTVNGMQVSEPRQVYCQIYEALKGGKVSANKAMTLLETEFCSAPHQRGDSNPPACVILLDELDLLCSRRQDVLYALFDWACRASVSTGGRKSTGRRPLVVLTIANTMDLPERVLHHRVASRLGLNRLAFGPYSHEQLAVIVKSCLGPELASSFDAKAIELATRKVAAVSGDARRALDICRRAAELAQQEGGQKVAAILHVNMALREMFTSPLLTALRCVSHYERLLLRAAVAEVAARGVEEVQLNRCLQQLYTLCGLEGVPRPTDTEVFAMCASLNAYKLISTEASRKDMNMLLRLNCSQSDVLFALKAAGA